MKRATVAVVILACSIAGAGCMTERYAQHREHYRHSRSDTLAVMTKTDVIALSAAKVSDDVIISQIKASGSYFELSTQDIIDLANSGVSDKVIDTMIRSGESAQYADSTRGYHYYPSSYWYGYPWWDPWYPSFSLGFSVGHYRPYYGYRAYYPRYSFYGYHGGGRAFGGGRSGGRHR